MIPIQNYVEDAIRKVNKFETGNCLDIRPFKRDRSVLIEKTGADVYTVYEDGFKTNTYENLSIEDLKKLLKSMHKIEFPRSNIVRFTVLKKRH